jgi:hypothetical protein
MSSCNPYKNLFGSTDVVYTLGMGAAKKAIFFNGNQPVRLRLCSVLFCDQRCIAEQEQTRPALDGSLLHCI